MPRPSRPGPRELVDDWPERASDDPVVEIARQFARNLREAAAGHSTRWVEERTGVDHTSVAGILAGRSWPDLRTIARLELGLGTSLWPVLGQLDDGVSD